MKRLLLILCMVLWVGQAWADPISKTVCASGCDYTTLKAAVDYIRTNGDGSSANTITISAGTYSNANDYALIDNANLTNLTIQGAGRGLTLLASTGGNGVSLTNAGGTGLTIKDLTFYPGTANRGFYAANLAGATANIIDCDFVARSGYTYNLFLNDGSTVNCTRCGFYHEWDATNSRNAVRLQNDADGTFSYCLSMAAGQTRTTTAWSFESSGTVYLVNSLILDAKTSAVSVTNGTVYIYNNIISAGIEATGSYAITRSGGTVTAGGNLLISGMWEATDHWINGTVTETPANIKTNINPMFTTHPRRGYILPRIDDAGNFAYAQSVATLLAAKNMTGTYVLQQVGWNTDNNADLRTMVSDGVMEVGVHSYSHSALQSTGKLWDVTKDAETITIDRTAGTITLSGGGSVSGFKAKSLATIKAELEGLGATVTGSDIYATDSATGKVNGGALGEVIADGAATNQIDLLVTDETEGLFKAEIADPKAWLATTIVNGAGNVTDGQTGTTYVTNSFGFPYNTSSADARLAAIGAGYTSASSGKITLAGNAGDYSYSMTDIDMYAIVDVNGSSYMQGTSEANTRYKARALAFAAAHTGLVIGILCHNATECSTDTWTYALDEWSQFGDDLNVTSRQLFRAAIAASHTDDTDGTYSKTFTNGTGDYRLQSSSPAINAGVVVSGVHPGTDYAGNPNYRGSAPDIGAYEYQAKRRGSGYSGEGGDSHPYHGGGMRP